MTTGVTEFDRSRTHDATLCGPVPYSGADPTTPRSVVQCLTQGRITRRHALWSSALLRGGTHNATLCGPVPYSGVELTTPRSVVQCLTQGWNSRRHALCGPVPCSGVELTTPRSVVQCLTQGRIQLVWMGGGQGHSLSKVFNIKRRGVQKLWGAR